MAANRSEDASLEPVQAGAWEAPPAGLDGERTVDALEGDGLDVLLDVDLWRCAEARVLNESRRETVIRWRPETRMRRFPLVKDPDWGLRLHRSDLAES